MQIKRPENIDDSSQTRVKGKLRITTRCLWLDQGKLLDALYKAAYAGLLSCPVNSPLAHMERIVSEVLRKMVRKYSSKRPEVIVIAVENTVDVFAEGLQTPLNGKSGIGFGLPSLSQPLAENIFRNKPKKNLNENSIIDNSLSAIFEEGNIWAHLNIRCINPWYSLIIQIGKDLKFV